MSERTTRDLSEILKQEELLRIEKEISLRKAFESTDANQVYKAKAYLDKQKDDMGGKSMLIDPQSNYTQTGGYKDKPSQLSFQVIRGMAKTHIIKAIIKTRKSQVANFLKPQKDKYSTGFIIAKKSKFTQNKVDKKLTKQEEEKVEYLTKFILECGITNNKWHGDTLNTFISKLIDDCLAIDSGAFEVRRNRRGDIIEFFAVDGGTIRLAETYWGDPEGKFPDLEINGFYPAYVQVYQHRVITQYYPWELGYCVRNASTDIEHNGYGKSELEDMIQTVTSILNADYYNANFFKVGSAPRGILKYTGNINQNSVEDLKRGWAAQMQGVENMNKMLTINADKLDFINTHVNNKDMEFGKFQDFLIKIACASYTIDPAEIGFPMEGSSDGKTPMFQGSNENRLKYSKDKGLKPLLEFIAFWLNKYILSEIDNEFELRFVGIDDEIDAEQELEGDIKAIGSFMTPNEIRAKRNLPPVEGGDVILNPVFIQNKQLATMGNPDANNVVDDMENNNEDGQENPFVSALKKSLETSLAA